MSTTPLTDSPARCSPPTSVEAKPNLERIKREAKKMRKESNGTKTHMQCLEEIARRLGFESYNALKVKADEHS